MKKPSPSRPKLTDAERYKRFLDMAEKAQASDSKQDFDAAILKVAPEPTHRPNPSDEIAHRSQGRCK